MEATFIDLCSSHGNRVTYWLLSLLQLVYPYDFRLTEKEVTTIFFFSGFKDTGQWQLRFSYCMFLFVAEN